ncbi:MAG: SGNH/GDSL hydrolase family protein [Clostridia bacterium]|nr:SGNH/GDSL hydrolase family protein [Clostridia bacterium]
MNDYKINTKYDKIIQMLALALGSNETALKEAILRSYVIDQDETNNRLRQVFCKAERGETITIAAIGGSIIEGAHARSQNGIGNNATAFTDDLSGEKCYFERTIDWFEETFPNTQINGINAGIGATPSFLGTFRLDQMVLNYSPDLVIIEFSVNDLDAVPFLLKDEIFESYESIVRRCLEKGIAVIPICLVNQNGDSLQKIHLELADHYNMPAISYHNAIFPDGQAVFDWKMLSPDEVHPNNAGHTLIATCIANYLDNVLESTRLTDEYITDELHTSWIYFDTFNKVNAQYAYEFKERARGGFEFQERIPNISYKWRGALVSDNVEGNIKIIVPKGACRVYVQFFNSNGSFETDFLNMKSSCNTTAIGWPRAMWHRVYTGKATTEDVTLTIKSHKNGKVIIMGVLISF